MGVWTGLSWLRIETGRGTYECGNEPSGSNAGNILTSCKLVTFSRRNLLCGISK
jgi:hypothetical protein